MALIGSQMSSLVEQDDIPEDVTAVLENMNQQQTSATLDENLRTLLAQVTSGKLLERIRTEGFSSLTSEERTRIAIALMRRYNKVTHIFELVKAFGSTSQVEYNRAEQLWQRRTHIAAKHEHEIAVNLFSGQKLTGDNHAPLIYVQDPRSDVPTELQRHLRQVIEGRDDVIVSGWLQTGNRSKLSQSSSNGL
jgi:hypothetical protein